MESKGYPPLSRCNRNSSAFSVAGIALALGSAPTPMIHFPPADRGQTELFGEPDRLSLLIQAANVIVLDDEGANVRLLTRTLERAGFHSVTGLTDPLKLHS